MEFFKIYLSVVMVTFAINYTMFMFFGVPNKPSDVDIDEINKRHIIAFFGQLLLAITLPAISTIATIKAYIDYGTTRK